MDAGLQTAPKGVKSRSRNKHACERRQRTNVNSKGEALLSLLYELCVTVTRNKL
jgi:hypothetical protein